MDMHLNSLSTKVAQMIRIGGKVTANPNESGGVQILPVLKGPLDGQQDIQSYQHYGFTSSPIPKSSDGTGGTDVVIVNANGTNQRGVVIATNDQTFRPINLNIGETQIWDNKGSKIYLQDGQIISIEANASINMTTNATVNVTSPTVTITASSKVAFESPMVTMSGELLVAGNITDLTASQSSTLGSLRADYDSHDHTVPGVEAGGSTVTTSKPNLQD
jgi:phage gp45-like